MNKRRLIISVFISAIILAMVCILPGCAQVGSSLNGSGKIIDQPLDIKNFTSINAKGAYTLIVSQADNFKVTLSTDDNLSNRLRISLERSTLMLNIEAPATFFPTQLKITVTMPKLLGLNLSGGAKATVAGFNSQDDFSLFIADKGTLDGKLAASNFNLNLSGGSKVVLSGSAVSLDLIANNSSILDLHDIVFTQAQIRLDNASEATLMVTGQFDVGLKNKSKLVFSGNPVFINTSVTGGSTMSMVQK
jgi:hypothetical protein